jgi:hypothetical protein
MIHAPVVFILGMAASFAAAQAPAAAPEPLPIGVSTQTVSTLYTGDRVRDPFLPAAMGVTSRRVEGNTDGPVTVDIHSLTLKGLLKDNVNDFALFSSDAGGTYMLRAGKLYNERGKPVPGISGRIRLKQKTVELITAEKDVQVFRLGEDEKDKDKEKP